MRERERENAAYEAYISFLWPDLKQIPILGHKCTCVRTHRHMRPDASQVARNLMMMDNHLEDLLTSCRVTASRSDVKAYASGRTNSVGSFWFSLERASGCMSSYVRMYE